jgi:hypothetical protein
MTRLLLTIGILLGCMACFSQRYYFFTDSLANTKEVLLRNHIKKVHVHAYKMKDGKFIDSTFTFTELYNDQGSITGRLTYTKDGTVMLTDSFFYNLNHQLARKALLNTRGDFVSQTAFIYNDQGKEIESFSKTLVQGSTMTYFEKKTYNTKGQLAEKYGSTDSSRWTLSEKYFYNSDGALEKKTTFDTTGKRTADYLFVVKNRKKIITTQNANGTGNTIEFFYNKNGQCTKIEWHLGKKPIVYYFTYNADGTMFECITVRGDGQKFMDRHYYERK